jgi:hypothetical protein
MGKKKMDEFSSSLGKKPGNPRAIAMDPHRCISSASPRLCVKFCFSTMIALGTA